MDKGPNDLEQQIDVLKVPVSTTYHAPFAVSKEEEGEE